MNTSASTKLLIIMASTRQGRLGEPITNWLVDVASSQGSFDIDVADLKQINLPSIAEPEMPATGKYSLPSTKAWAARVAAACAVVVVCPEYNHSFPGALKIALDTLGPEWRGKPMGMIYYGALAGGGRAQVALQPVLNILGIKVLPGAVNFPNAWQHLTSNGQFEPGEAAAGRVVALLDSLAAATS